MKELFSIWFDLIFFLYQKLAEVKIEVRDREEQVQEKQVIIIIDNETNSVWEKSYKNFQLWLKGLH